MTNNESPGEMFNRIVAEAERQRQSSRPGPHPGVQKPGSGQRSGIGQGPQGIRENPDPGVGSSGNPFKKDTVTWRWREKLIGAASLCDKHFDPVRWVVPGLFPEGVSILASRPKIGKSWLALQVTSTVALGRTSLTGGGGDQPVPGGDVLYLALEDGERRLQRRMTKHFGAQRECWPERLGFAFGWRRLDQGGLDDLREWCRSVIKPTLIVVDTLEKVRPPKRRDQSDYAADYEACEGLVKLTHEFPGLGVIVVHHDREMAADDVFDTVSGTLGLTGGVDTIAVIKRAGHGTTLHIEGRDLVETVEKAINFDRETCRWTILGEAAEVQRSDERSRVLKVLQDAPEGLETSEIIGEADLQGRDTAKVLLSRMAKEGEIERVKRGLYGLPGTRANLSAEKADRRSSRRVGVLPSNAADVGNNEKACNLCYQVTSEPKQLKSQLDEDRSNLVTEVTHLLPSNQDNNRVPLTSKSDDIPTPTAEARHKVDIASLDATQTREPSAASAASVSTPQQFRCVRCNDGPPGLEWGPDPRNEAEDVWLHAPCRSKWKREIQARQKAGSSSCPE
jgi:hypothetical protein